MHSNVVSLLDAPAADESDEESDDESASLLDDDGRARFPETFVES